MLVQKVYRFGMRVRVAVRLDSDGQVRQYRRLNRRAAVILPFLVDASRRFHVSACINGNHQEYPYLTNIRISPPSLLSFDSLAASDWNFMGNFETGCDQC